MTDLRAAAYMALEFLEHVDRFDPNGRYGLDEKIDALIQALAQAEREAVEYDAPALYKAKAEREKEPLCWLKETGSIGGGYEQTAWGDTFGFPVYTAPVSKQEPDAFLFNDMTWTPAKSWTTKVDGGTPVYGFPPSKPWVSLSDEQIEGIAKCYALNNPATPLHFARSIEAASKELNHG